VAGGKERDDRPKAGQKRSWEAEDIEEDTRNCERKENRSKKNMEITGNGSLWDKKQPGMGGGDFQRREWVWSAKRKCVVNARQPLFEGATEGKRRSGLRSSEKAK